MINTEENLLDGLQAVLFDMDGVIIDGMPFHAKAWQQAFLEIGLSITPREVYEREGESGLAAVAAFLKKRGLTPPENEILALIKRKETIFKEIVDAKPFAGIRSFVDRLLLKGKLLALVTGTARHELNQSLPEDIQNKFEIIITGDEVKKGKPDPEPYKLALKKLALTSDQAIVIENAPLGIKSARRAGIHCLAVATSLPQSYLTEANNCFENINELAAYLLA